MDAVLYRVLHEPADLGGCPPPLRGLVERCLAKAPAQRPSPGELIDECRARTAGHTLQIAQTWLPAAVSADLARHLPPTAPPMPHEPTATVEPGWPRRGAAQRPGRPAAGASPAGP